jgi:uncharacterized protein YcbX
MKTTISHLYLYPIKGCRGLQLRSATLAATGLEVDGIGDREWLIVDADGEFLSQRELPKMALIETHMTPSSLRLKAPGMLHLEVPFASEGDVVQVRVWDDRIAAVTQGAIADAWLSAYLGLPARLVRFDPEHTRLAGHRWTGKDDAPFKFADGFPLLVTSDASLADLNARLARQGHAAVGHERFRPNVVLTGLAPFEEDYVQSLGIGAAQLRPVKPCARCTVPGVDPATGEQAPTVPDLLAQFRRTNHGVIFGVNAIVTAGVGSTLRAGDAVEVALRV